MVKTRGMKQKMIANNNEKVKKCTVKTSSSKMPSENKRNVEPTIDDLLLLCKPLTIRLPKLKIREYSVAKTVAGKLFEEKENILFFNK